MTNQVLEECVEYSRANPAIAQKYDEALQGLAANTRSLFNYAQPVLIEGGYYQGIWLECGPLEGLVYGKYAPQIAIANHDIFFHFQREDGYLPCYIWPATARHRPDPNGCADCRNCLGSSPANQQRRIFKPCV
jgi:hypothetical protein